MIHKDDWEEARTRWQAWWSGEALDRPIVQVTAPRKGSGARSDWNAWRLAHSLDNPQRAFEEFEELCRQTFFGGEAVPNLWVNLGPGITAAYLGSTPQIEEDTVWFEARESQTWEGLLGLELDPANKWWALTKELTMRASDYAQGRFSVGVTDLNAVLNVLGFLRGTQQLLTDLVDSPGEVRAVCERITEVWLACYDELLQITQRNFEGAITWMGIWFPGRGSDVQCDFSAMLSPKMFEEFVAPDIQEQCRRLDYSIYHWDGPGQIPHLDILLDIPELDGIQWVPGAGNPGQGSPKWFPLYKRIQERKKLLVLNAMAKEDIETVLGELSPRGLLIGTGCDSQEEARDLLRKVEQWSNRR